MKKILFAVFLSAIVIISNAQDQQNTGTPVRTVFATGGALNETLMRYLVSLTGKENPTICSIPTAAGDNPYALIYWYELCKNLPVKTSVLRVFISSSPGQKTFEEIILSSDAVVVGGGNTLNMMGIWKAQGIDTVLMKAYKRGIIMSGASAGSLCWFREGITDSRPQKLSVVQCLGFINASHCPHYSSEPLRKPLYEKLIMSNGMMPGYACDNFAAMVFKNEQLVKTVTANPDDFVYYVSVKNGKLDTQKMESELIK
jgi:peptidase E